MLGECVVLLLRREHECWWGPTLGEAALLGVIHEAAADMELHVVAIIVILHMRMRTITLVNDNSTLTRARTH